MRPDAQILDALLVYDSASGKMTWKHRDVSLFSDSKARRAESHAKWWNGRFAGKEAFTAAGVHGCKIGRIFGAPYYAHHVVWALHYGEWPSDDIDHLDGDRSNNKISNLRLVSHQENMQNKALYKSSKTGCHGVAWHARREKFQAYITVNKSRKHLGYFGSKTDAISARTSAEMSYGCFHLNHGRLPCLAS